MNDRDLYVNVVGEKKKDYWLKGMEKVIMYSTVVASGNNPELSERRRKKFWHVCVSPISS
jgi:hypothetical protein